MLYAKMNQIIDEVKSDVAERDELEIFMDNDQIVLQKFEPSCIFCSSSQGLVSYRGKNVCQQCIRNIGKF